jgi:hypothetical protein
MDCSQNILGLRAKSIGDLIPCTDGTTDDQPQQDFNPENCSPHFCASSRSHTRTGCHAPQFTCKMRFAFGPGFEGAFVIRNYVVKLGFNSP